MMTLPQFYTTANKKVKILIILGLLVMGLVLTLNLVIFVQGYRAGTRVKNYMNTISSPDQLVMERTENKGCTSTLRTGINFVNTHDVICNYYGYKFFKGKGDYVQTLSRVHDALIGEGREVSGAICDNPINCLVAKYGDRAGEHVSVNLGYGHESPYVGLVAFHRNDNLTANSADEYAHLRDLLQNGDEFIYGYIVSDSYFSYARPLW